MWIFFASTAGIFLACFMNTTVFLKKEEPGFGKFIMASGVVSLTFIPLAPWDTPLKVVMFAVGAGFAYACANVPFFLCYNYISPLTAAILATLMPGYIAIGAWAFLGERMALAQFAVFATMLTGTLLAAFDKRGEKWNTAKGVILMMVALVFSTIYNLLTRHVSKESGVSAWDLFAFNRVGFVLNAFIFLAIPCARSRMLSLFSSRLQLGFYGNEALTALFVVFVIFAISALPGHLNTGFVNIVYFSITQVLLFGYFFFVKKQAVLARKFVGASIAFAGLVYLVTH